MTLSTQDELSKLDACIHCGMCLPACPTYNQTHQETQSPRGRLYLMRAFLENRLEKPEDLERHLDPCLGCLSCESACPSGVNYESLLINSREKLTQVDGNWFKQLRRQIRRFSLAYLLRHMESLEYVAQGIQLLDKLGLRQWLSASGLLNLPGLKVLRFLPSIQPGFPLTPGEVFGENRKGRVAMLTGCIMNTAFRQTHRATVDVLVRNGYQVVIPEQTCCGALAYHSGEMDIFQNLVALNWLWMKDSAFDWIVVNSAGCGSAMKHYAPYAPTKGSNPYAVTDRVVDVMELLAKEPLEGPIGELNLKATYHAACHLHHAQGIRREPYEVLLQIPGLELIPLKNADQCCGSAGVYNLAHPDMSQAILDDKTTHVLNTGASIVLTGNPGCMMQLEAGLREADSKMLVLHPIELLHMAYNAASSPPSSPEENVLHAKAPSV
jgi:glycolate oxidase iron-sulfur subunit